MALSHYRLPQQLLKVYQWAKYVAAEVLFTSTKQGNGVMGKWEQPWQ